MIVLVLLLEVMEYWEKQKKQKTLRIHFNINPLFLILCRLNSYKLQMISMHTARLRSNRYPQ